MRPTAWLFATAIFGVASAARADPLDTWGSQPIVTGSGVDFWDGHFVTRGFASPDGVTWGPVQTAIQTVPVHVTKGNGVYVASEFDSIQTSTNGLQWQKRVFSQATSSAFGNGIWVAGGPSATYFTSSDAITWAHHPVPTGANAILDVIFANGQFVAATGNGVWSSSDGLQWTQRLSSAALRRVVFGNGRYVAVGNAIATSTDAVHWTTVTSPAALGSLAYGNGQFVAVGKVANATDTYLTTSTDGTTWTARAPLPAHGAPEIAFGKGRFVVLVKTTSGATAFTSAPPDKVVPPPTTPTTTATVPKVPSAAKVTP